MVTTRSKTAEASASHTVLKYTLQKFTILSGIKMIFFACIQGFLIADMPNKVMGKSAHHQFTHNGELLIALAFAFPYCKLSRPLLIATFVLLQLGTWANGLSYLVVAFTDCPCPIFANSPGTSIYKSCMVT
jgi:hypothetical protein